MDLSKLANKKVAAAAKKLADRVKNIDDGLLQAQRLGLPGISSLKAERDLKLVIELADANADDAMLVQLNSAMSFSGKKSVKEWTKKSGRNRVRAVHLFRALEGDRSYQTIKANIGKLPTGEKELRALARDEKLLASLDTTAYVDEGKLLKAIDGSKLAIKEVNREWYLDQATLMEAFRAQEGVDPDLQRRLALVMLQAYSKAANINDEAAQRLDAQTTPFFNMMPRYHRSQQPGAGTAGDEEFGYLDKVRQDCVPALGLTPDLTNDFRLVHNRTFREQLHRQFALEGLNTRIDSQQQFETACDDLFDELDTLTPKHDDDDEPHWQGVVFDVTGLFLASGRPLSEGRAFAAGLAKVFCDRLAAWSFGPVPEQPDDDLEQVDVNGPPDESPPPQDLPKPPEEPPPPLNLEYVRLAWFSRQKLRRPVQQPQVRPQVVQPNALRGALQGAQLAPDNHKPVAECDQVRQLHELERPANVVTPTLELQGPVASSADDEVEVLSMPPFLQLCPAQAKQGYPTELQKALGKCDSDSHVQFQIAIREAMVHTGYRLDPIQVKQAWLSVLDAPAVLRKASLQLTQLATPERQATVCKNLGAFLTHNTFKQFEKLSEPAQAAPYLRVLPAATAALLRGLLDYAFTDRPRTVKVVARLGETEAQPAYAGTGTVATAEGDAQVFTDEACTTAAAPLATAALRRGVDLFVRGKPATPNRLTLTLQAGNDPKLEVKGPAELRPFGTKAAAWAAAEGAGLDKHFRAKGLDDLLQASYFRLLNAMAQATQDKDDLIKLWNQIEVIHQELFNFIALVEPYAAGDFETAARAAYAAAQVIPQALGAPRVFAKPSAMHCLANILSSAEAQKASNALNVCVLVDNYYEGSVFLIPTHKTYKLVELKGDLLRDAQGRDVAIDAAQFAGKTPLDVFVCDFHHNISLFRTHYMVENLKFQVDELFRCNLVAGKFTVAIDCTVDLLASDDVKAFLAHNQQRISQGALNVVLYRSAQKFDMLGLDNYYGGYAALINKAADYQAFNDRMALPEDQLGGIFAQGLTHLLKYGAAHADRYRQALMANTKRLYDALPPGLIWSQGTTAPVQVSKVDDPRGVFLDIKCPDNDALHDALADKLKEFAETKKLPFTGRASFGFPTSNFTLIRSGCWRLNPGLEGTAINDQWAGFLGAVHTCVTAAQRAGTQAGKKDGALKQHIADALKGMKLP